MRKPIGTLIHDACKTLHKIKDDQNSIKILTAKCFVALISNFRLNFSVLVYKYTPLQFAELVQRRCFVCVF